MVDTLINGVEQLNKVSSGYKIKYNYDTTDDISDLLISNHNGKDFYFKNPLIFALFKSHSADENNDTNIDDIKQTSEHIVIKVGQFGSGATTKDVSFGFVDKSSPNNVIFLNSSLFGQFKGSGSDEVKKYALVLLEQYYNDNNNSNNRDKIKTLCAAESTIHGGNPIKDSTRSRTLTKTRKKRKIPKK